MTGRGDKVLVVAHIPGIDAFRVRQSGDRNYAVLTVLDGRITALAPAVITMRRVTWPGWGSSRGFRPEKALLLG
jgi:hypothetical protein